MALAILGAHEELMLLDGSSGLPCLQDFIGFLQNCRQGHNVEVAIHALEHACGYGIEAHAAIGNYLVPTLVDCGSLSLALRALNRMNGGNEHSLTSIIQAYMECGNMDIANLLYHQLQEIDLPPSRHALIVLLNACARFKSLEFGRNLHKDIDESVLQEDLFLGSAVVNMYAKCGSLGDASEVFHKMDVQDVVAWTALIAGYAEYGHGDQVLSCLNQMQLQGMSPDPVTLVCGVKACTCLGNLEMGQAMHAEVIKKGFDSDIFLGNSLVDMYSKCGSMFEAQVVFNGLLVRTSVSWNALITGYSDHDLCQKSVICFHDMQKEGFYPDTATFCCVLRACSTLAAIHEGNEIHTQIIMKGWEQNVFIGTALVDMYSKCHLLSEARDVLEKIMGRNTVSWNSLIAGYADEGLCKETLDCVERMHLDGVQMDAITYTCCLRAASISQDIDMVKEIHHKMEVAGHLHDLFVGTTLVDTYVKCGLLAQAQQVFDMLPSRHLVSWTTLMAGYVDHGFNDKALICLQQMQAEGITANAITLMCALKACGSIQDHERAKEIHAEIIKKHLEEDDAVGNSLIDTYMKCGLFTEGMEVFYRLPMENVVNWTTLIAGFMDGGHAKEALNYFEQMQAKGVVPDAIAFFSCLKACISLENMDKGQDIHAEVVKEGLEGDLFVGSSLVDMYARGGLFVEAKDVFESIQGKDVVVWTALITGYTERGLIEEGWYLFQSMQVAGVSPDVVAWNAVIVGFAGHGEIGMAWSCCAQMQEQGMAPSCMVFTSILKASGNAAALLTGKRVHALINTSAIEGMDVRLVISLIEMYCKCGCSYYARMVFYDMGFKDMEVWNALLTGYGHLGESHYLFAMLIVAINNSYLDELTLLSVLNACCHAGLVDVGLRCFIGLCEVSSLSLTYENCNCMIDLIARAGRLHEAVAMVEELPFQSDEVTWSIVLGACQKWGDAELGCHAFRYATRLPDNHASPFVMMSNISFDTGICLAKELLDSFPP